MNAQTLTVSDYRASLVSAFEARTQYEMSKDSRESMFAKLNAMLKGVDHDRIAEIMLNAGCDASRINRQERNNARYNIYAYEKDINIARTIAKVATLNHYTYHILKTAKALHDVEMTLTHDDAFCACMKGSKPKDAKKAKLISRYTRLEVATGTATTQSSSSINALESFKVLVQVRDEQGRVAYRLNLDSEATQALLETLA